MIFDRPARLTLVDGRPKEKVTVEMVWSKGMFGATFRSAFCGSVVNPNARNLPMTSCSARLLGQKTLFDPWTGGAA